MQFIKHRFILAAVRIMPKEVLQGQVTLQNPPSELDNINAWQVADRQKAANQIAGSEMIAAARGDKYARPMDLLLSSAVSGRPFLPLTQGTGGFCTRV